MTGIQSRSAPNCNGNFFATAEIQNPIPPVFLDLNVCKQNLVCLRRMVPSINSVSCYVPNDVYK